MNQKIQIAAAGAAFSVMMLVASALPAFAAVSDYEVNPTNAAMVNEMSVGSTQSFLALFQSNWPVIVGFAITILGSFFIWNLIKSHLHHK